MSDAAAFAWVLFALASLIALVTAATVDTFNGAERGGALAGVLAFDALIVAVFSAAGRHDAKIRDEEDDTL